MIKNYTTTLEGVNSPDVEVAQFTFNGRIMPIKRDYPSLIKKIDPEKTVVAHYDFIWVLSRFALFTENIKRMIVDEIADLMQNTYPCKVAGLVMHMDFPLKKSLYMKEVSDISQVEAEYKKKIYNIEAIFKYVSTEDYKQMYLDGLRDFANRLWSKLPAYITRTDMSGSCTFFKIYLENTTMVNRKAFKAGLSPQDIEGSAEFILNLLEENPYLTDLYGVCLDTEHHFAVTGESIDSLLARAIKDRIDVMVHVNAIPSEVGPRSLKDKHSFTLLSECSQFPIEYYKGLIDRLNANGITWVREVKDTTRIIEQSEEVWL